MYKIYKKFKFDAAHRILGHTGKCANVHGHTYEVILELGSKTLNDMDVVRDYYSLKCFKEYVDNIFDHAMIISVDDKELKEVMDALGTKRTIVPSSTSEKLAEHFYGVACDMFKDGEACEVLSVEVKETTSTGAVFHV